VAMRQVFRIAHSSGPWKDANDIERPESTTSSLDG
jgi:hypothetical protein